MAEIISSSGKTSKKGKRLSTRVDLTPMVDLGFLLITFFIFTTTMSQASVLNLPLPDDRTPAPPILLPSSKSLNIILGADNKLWYYPGDSIHQIRSITYRASELREVIARKRELVAQTFGDPGELVVLIKSTRDASYGNLVNVLDEMIIGAVKRHMLVEPSKEEVKIIDTSNK